MAAMTNVTSLTNTIKTYYDRVLLEALDPQLKYYQFGIKKPLPKGEGTSVIWNLPRRLSIGVTLTEGTPVTLTNGWALSTTKVSAIIDQYGDWTDISDLVSMTSITDVMKMAVERLGAQAGETLERVIINKFISHISILGHSSHHMYKTSGAIYDYWGSVSGVSVCSDGTAPGGPLAGGTYANVISVSDVRKAIYTLKRLNAEPYDGGDYVAIINTETAEDLVGDSTWINFHQYADKGVGNLYNGEIGKIYGCRFVETTQGPAVRGIGDSLSTVSAVLYGTAIFGKGFFGVTELDGGIKTYLSEGASKADALNQTTVYGWKANFATSYLQCSAGLVFWAGSGDTTVVGDESATGSVLRYKAPA